MKSSSVGKVSSKMLNYITSYGLLKVISAITILLSPNCNELHYELLSPKWHYKTPKCSLLLLILHPVEGNPVGLYSIT